MCGNPHFPNKPSYQTLETHMTHPRQSISFSVTPFVSTMPWECAECTHINNGSPVGKGPCVMCMHDNPHRIKVEAEDIDMCPSQLARLLGQ